MTGKNELDEAKEALANFKGGRRGQKLEELQLSKELSQWEREQLTRLEADEKELRERIKTWEEQVVFLQRQPTTQPGNDFVTRALGT